MKKKKPEGPLMKLSEYLWDFHKIADIDIETANKMKAEALKVQDHGQRTKMKMVTSTLRAADWDVIYEKHKP